MGRCGDGNHYRFSESTLVAAILLSNAILLCFVCQRQPDPSPASSHARVDSNNHLASLHSFGFFDDISNDEWTRFYQQPALKADHYQRPQVPSYGIENAAGWIFRNWDPFFSCPHLERVGGDLGDGPKWTCDPERLQKLVEERKRKQQRQDPPPCLIYSMESSGNFRWEKAMQERMGSLCEFHIFYDPNKPPPALEDMKNNAMQFHPWEFIGISTNRGQQDAEGGGIISFQEMRQKLGHTNRIVDILKVDCEGCEWYMTAQDWIDVVDIRQILVDTHDLPQGPIKPNKRTATFGYLPSIDPTQYLDALYAQGYVLYSKRIHSASAPGTCAEWSFLKMHSGFFSTNSTTTTTESDSASRTPV